MNTVIEMIMSSNSVILETVFRHLSPSDIKRASLVSKTWRRILNRPRFWSKMKLRIFNRSDRTFQVKVMKSRIIQLVSEIEISAVAGVNSNLINMIEKLFNSIVSGKLPQLKIILTRGDKCSKNFDLSSLSPELISQTVIRLEKCDFTMFNFSANQIITILENIIQTKHLKLKELFLFNYSQRKKFYTIPANIMMQAALRLEVSDITSFFLRSDEDIKSWYKLIGETHILRIRYMENLRQTFCVPPDVLTAAMLRIENIEMSVLTENQSLSLFNKIVSSENMKLKKIRLMHCDLSHISPDILSQAVFRLEEVLIYEDLIITPQQIQSISNKIATPRGDNFTIKRLVIACQNNPYLFPLDMVKRGKNVQEIKFTPDPLSALLFTGFGFDRSFIEIIFH